MKKLLFIVFLAIFLIVPNQLYAQTNFTNEHIRSFTSEVEVNQDGSLNITEEIIYDFGDLERHGIFRNIPYTKYDENNTRYDITFEDFEVVDESGENYEFEKSTEDEQIILKIGDPDETITDTQTYIISYSVEGAIGYFENYDEVYWNATGNFWDVPIATASASIVLPQNIEPDALQTECFTGKQGSNTSICSIYKTNHSVNFYTNNPLNSNEGLTVLTSLPKGAIAHLPAEEHVSFWDTAFGKLTIVGIILAAIFWYIALPIILIYRYFKHGRDPDVGKTATAWYDPPKTKSGRNLSPAETGGLVDEHVDTKDIFAAIIDLARRGYINIKEYEKKKFKLVYKNKPEKKDKLLPYEKELIDGIFEDGKEVNLKDVKFYKTVEKVEKMIYENLVEEGYFNSNPKKTRNKYYALGGIALGTANLVLAFVAFVFGRFMPRKTMFGAKSANVGKGIKNFLESQSRQLNYQGDKQLFFEKLLPFAVAFGVEKNWAQRFKDFKIKQPDWYQGSSGNKFTTAAFASSLSNSYKGFSASSTPPSSSSSGFSSGGGFSGGGAGGGGGGSW